jgi:hypothetical protein
MGGNRSIISPTDLNRRVVNAPAPMLIDIRRGDSFLTEHRMIIGAFRRSSTDVEHWRRESFRQLPEQSRMLKHGLVTCDVLYTWCRCRTKTRGHPAAPGRRVTAVATVDREKSP